MSEPTPHPIEVDGYLARIGLAGRPAADVAGLRALQVAHLAHVPFENLDILAGRPISLRLADIEAKIVGAHRGGFCYELNGLFAELLGALGFRVTHLAAEVWSRDTLTWGPPFDHLVLRVDLDDPWLVDVGFGDGLPEPLELREGASVRDADGRVFGLRRDDDGWLLTERPADSAEALPVFRLRDAPHVLEDFAPTCRWQETESPFFTGHRVVEISTPDGRCALYDDRLIVHVGAARTERGVTEEEVPALLRERFRIDPPATR